MDESIKPQAHSDYVYDYINTYGNDVDIMIEAKHKELAVDKYKKLHQRVHQSNSLFNKKSNNYIYG
jgi:UV DNA damage endonuclease